MSIQKVNHSVWHPWTGTDGALAAVGAGDNQTSDWHDINGWTDKRLSWVVTGANTDADIILHISPKGEYELNQITADTTDYEVLAAVTAHAAQIMASIDAEDLDELQRPIRSMRINISNDSATAITAFEVWLEGWS